MRKGLVSIALPVMMMAFCAGEAALSAQAPAAQAPEGSKNPYVFKTSSRLVLVDVVATNGKGEPVTDLAAHDFTLIEDGHPQTLSSFGFHSGESAAGQAEAGLALAPPAPGVVTNVPRYKNARSWNVIVLDSLNSPMLDQSNTRQQLLQVLGKIPDQPVAIYVLGTQLRMIQDFSADPRALKQVIAGLTNKSSPLLDNPKGGHEAERYSAPFFQSLPAQIQANILRWEGEGTAAHTRNRLQLTLEALNTIARNLKPLPGRKNLIWISEGFPFSLDPGNIATGHDKVSGMDYKVAVAATANALFDSQVAIYPIDSRGILSSGFYDAASHNVDAMGRKESQAGGTDNTVSEENADWDATHASMQEMAERTGGRAFYNRNGIGNAVLESLNDGATYYTLAYAPTNKDWNGRFRHIKVKAARDGLKLRYRLGYFAVASTTGSKTEEEATFHRAMDLNSPASTGVLFQAKVLQPAENQVVVNYAIAAAGLSFQQGPDQLQHLTVECAVEAYSEKNGRVQKEGTTMTAALEPGMYARILREGFPCQQKLSLPPGEYVLRLGVRDMATGQTGTTDARITVPARQPEKTRP
jgi:VWFA-related protein